MLQKRNSTRSTLSLTLALAIGALLAHAGPAAAGEVSAEQILKALHDQPTRGLTIQERRRDSEFVRRLREKPGLALTTMEDEETLATVMEDKRKTDLEINFEFDSATLTRDGMRQAHELGKAMRDSRSKGGFFMLAGYTDAKGSYSYNEQLSRRRAEAVKRYLVDKFDIEPDNLVTHGFGKTHLKDPDHPYAVENRRVTVVNMEPKSAAR